MADEAMQRVSTERKHPCPDCKMCQNCSESRCCKCRNRKNAHGKKLSIKEQIELYNMLNPELSGREPVLYCKNGC